MTLNDENALVIPESWHTHLDGRPGGRLDSGIIVSLDEFYECVEPSGTSWDQFQFFRDRLDLPYTLVADRGAEALATLQAEFADFGSYEDGAVQRAAAKAISVIPTDDAFAALLDLATQGLFIDHPEIARVERYYQGKERSGTAGCSARSRAGFQTAARSSSPSSQGSRWGWSPRPGPKPSTPSFAKRRGSLSTRRPSTRSPSVSSSPSSRASRSDVLGCPAPLRYWLWQ